MSVQKSDKFISDVERQFEWYVVEADWDIAHGYLKAVEATCRLLSQHPLLGKPGGFLHPRLLNWRFIVVSRPFQKHLLFYESDGREVRLR